MKLRNGLLVLSVVLAAAGCAREQGGSPGASMGARMPGNGHGGAWAAQPAAARFAYLPDRGELVAYPGHVKRVDGAYTLFRTDLSEAHALRAITDEHLRLTTPEGQLLDVRYDHHVEHPSGDWTWVGHLPGDPSAQTIITFGDEAAYGSIAQPNGQPPLRLTMRDGQSWLVETDPRKVAAIVNAETRPTKPDYHIVDRALLGGGSVHAAAAPVAPTSAASATATYTIDLLIGYTQGLVTRLGSTSAVNTRLNYLVDVANAALGNSQVSAQVRLVHAMQVTYTDTNTNDIALQKMSGRDANGNPATPDPAFTALRNAREQYGADLVTLVRPFVDPEQDSCGLAWLIGGGLQGVQAGVGWDQLAYSVVGDGSDVGTDGKTYYCRDETLAHEMGHNEGAAHDRATSQGTDGVLNNPDDYGAYTYSFGYKTTSTTGNFYTVMAYGDSGQTGYRVFSNPRITFCGGRACGTTTYEDNARSLGQAIPVVAGFRATAVPMVGAHPRGDFDGDGRSDILWRNTSSGAGTIWKAANSSTQQGLTTVSNLDWAVVGVGDFDGDGKGDVLWRNGSTGGNTIWRSGNSTTQQAVTSVSNVDWRVVGVDDFDGDGKADILWRNATTGANTIWKSGSAATQQPVTTVGNVDWKVVGVGDFDGDGKADILWRNAGSGQNTIWKSGNSATQQAMTSVNSSWSVAGVGDFDGDGKADVFWRSTSGGNVIWKSANAATQQAVTTLGNMQWFVAAVADYDGDGKADVLWRNGSTGANTIWRAAASSNQQAVSSVSNLAWHVFA